ncbi:MAG TPA: hypothetical protein VEL47_06735 [Myxococcota bacterium]|nr:hypothetical protein [Myxococcota bacterium]
MLIRVLFLLMGFCSNLFAVKEFAEQALDPPARPTSVKIGVQLLNIVSIEPASTENPTLTARFQVKIQWTDKRLIEPGMPDGLVRRYQDEEATKKLDQIFDPQVRILEGIFNIDHQYLSIFSDGLVVLSQLATVIIGAKMSLLQFPFDTQNFNFRFASTHWDKNAVALAMDPLAMGLSENASPESWHFDYFTYHLSEVEARLQNEYVSVFNYLAHGQRDPYSFLWRLLIPLMMMVLLSWTSFWIYEDTASTLGNCILFLLTVVTFHQLADSMLPMIPALTFLDAIVFLSYGYIIIPTFELMLSAKLKYLGKPELVEDIRDYCRWLVPGSFVLILLGATFIYFARG